MALNFDHMHAQTVLVYGTVNTDTIHTARQQQHTAFVSGSGYVRVSGSVSLLAWALRSRLRPSLTLCSPVPTHH
jgi:hypothetical protein